MGNNGIILGKDSSLKSDNIAVGKGATINHIKNSAGSDKDALVVKMNELIDLLHAHQADIDNADELIESTQLVSAELQKEKPNKTLINTIMETVKSSVSLFKDVATVATAVHTLILPQLK